EWWRLAAAILASGGLPAKRRPSDSAIRRPGTWAERRVGLHLFFAEEVAKLLGIPYSEVVVHFFCWCWGYCRDRPQGCGGRKNLRSLLFSLSPLIFVLSYGFVLRA